MKKLIAVGLVISALLLVSCQKTEHARVVGVSMSVAADALVTGRGDTRYEGLLIIERSNGERIEALCDTALIRELTSGDMVEIEFDKELDSWKVVQISPSIEAVAAYLDLLAAEDAVIRAQAAKALVEMDVPAALTERERAMAILEKDAYVELSYRYQSGRLSTTALMDMDRRRVAYRHVQYHEFNDTLVSREVVTVWDGTMDTILVTEYDGYGRPIDPVYLCLDIMGSLLTRDGESITVPRSAFSPRQQTDTAFSGTEAEGATVYVCENCAGATGVDQCRFVW
jgi:hypothetical protein